MTTPEPYSAGTVWVESVLDPGEPFRIKLHPNQRTWTLGRAGAVRLLIKTGVSVDAAERLITEDLQPDREMLDSEGLDPLGLEIGVTPGGKPFIMILLEGQPVGQWDVKDAVEHAETVLGSMFTAGLDAGRARNVVRSLGEHRQL